MSEDLKVLIECDHRVLDERFFIDERDFRTVFFPYPIANSQLIVRINGYLIDPLNSIHGYGSSNTVGGISINLFVDETSVSPRRQKLVFNLPQAADDIIEISYTSPAAYCQKCFGTGLVYDYQVKSDGSGFTKVTGISKLRQDCLKAILTVRASNPFHVWAGTSIESLVGEKYSEIALFELKREIGNVLNNLRNMQIRQSGYQTVTPDELLSSVDNISIIRDVYDPTLILIEVDVTSNSGQSVSITQAFRSTGSVSGLLNA